jgi:hypothetical protein
MLSELDPTLVDRQTRNNRETEDLWDLYEEHRLRVNSLIEAHTPADRLVVLGAGNANSFDLASLRTRFSALHLADLDPTALAHGVEKQLAADRNKLELYAPIDLSGVLARLPAWARTPPDIDELRALPGAVSAHLASALHGPFDVVVSEGLLSQILFTCFKALGEGPPLMRVLPWVVLAHLRALVALARPGGSCLLVTDTASSEGLPPQELLPQSDGRALLDDLDRQGKLFTGTSPALLTKALRQDGLAGRVESVRFAPPWHWKFLRERSALVYALAFRTRA